ncbi:Zinc finger CCCH domain-containing protein 11 [Ananas comosus]|uniref:Zinc finger CCCH domain-containing protein 11 n=1 Tax=Ananas comosus TaxID=4615 RepID=A0A199W6D1_ANACO|nr:Zinc finger CCCH domain-containing protein 11 [Ananas comosus]
MPPKNQASKADLAKKQKVVEDKTFGLKNKNKSKNVQKYVQSLQQSVQPKPDPSKAAAKKKKEEEKARDKELNDLFKIAVSQPKVPVGVDPKSILCEFFKAGQCQKGFKCKFSHDLNVQRKGEKIDIYTDKQTMEDWDQETLEKVVESKKNEYNQNKPTDIVCKYFLEAVEKKQYGWFWVCPNGGKDCHYRHALPPGYVLKSQMKALLEEEAEKMPIEEEIEEQRSKLTASTPITPELFMQWKNKKMKEREAGLAALRAERAKNDRMSGRELFLSDASLFVDDAEAYDIYEREEEPDAAEERVKDNKTQPEGPSSSTSFSKEAEEVLAEEDDDDDELDIDELNELEASLSKASIQIREPSIEASS